jgi:alpha-L-fucosidase
MLEWRGGKGDITRDFVDSCRKHGIQPGVFTTTRFDNRLGINNSAPMKNAIITREQYNRLVEAETEELLSRYGDLFELWLDGSARTPAQGGPDLLPIFEKHQPQSSIFYHTDDRRDIRWGGNEDGVVGDPCWSTVLDPRKMNWGTGSPDGAFWCPAMADTPLGHDWFWRRDGNRGIKSLDTLQRIYLNSVGRNATLVIGLTPDTTGLVPSTDVERCREFGAWIKTTFGGTPLAKTAGRGNSLTLELPSAGEKSDLYVVVQEDIRQGERVREYVLEREENGVWVACRRGTNIGHKRIIKLDSLATTRLRITMAKFIAEPIIAAFSAYRALGEQP